MFLSCSNVGEQQHKGNVTVVILIQILYLHSNDLRLMPVTMPEQLPVVSFRILRI